MFSAVANRRVFAATRLRCSPDVWKIRKARARTRRHRAGGARHGARVLVLRRRELRGGRAVRVQRRNGLLPGVRRRRRLRSSLPQHGPLRRRVRRRLHARMPRRERLLRGLRRQLRDQLPQHGLVRRLLRRQLPLRLPDVDRCGVRAGPGSVITCTSVTTCVVECLGSCQVICNDTNPCDVTCPGGAAPSSCANGTLRVRIMLRRGCLADLAEGRRRLRRYRAGPAAVGRRGPGGRSAHHRTARGADRLCRRARAAPRVRVGSSRTRLRARAAGIGRARQLRRRPRRIHPRRQRLGRHRVRPGLRPLRRAVRVQRLPRSVPALRARSRRNRRSAPTSPRTAARYNYVFMPVVMQWNFWLTERFSAFGEPGVDLLSPRQLRLRRRPALYVGGRFRARRPHHADRPHRLPDARPSASRS